MQLILNNMVTLWALMLMASLALGITGSNLDAHGELYRRELIVPRVVAPSSTVLTPPAMITTSLSESNGLTVIETETEIECTGSETQTDTPARTSWLSVVATETDTRCPESEPPTAVPVTVIKCSGGSAGCTGLVTGVYPTAPSVIEVFTTETVTYTTCPHSSGECTTKLTTLVTPVRFTRTGTLVPPMPTSGHYANTTEKTGSSPQSTNPANPVFSTTSKSPVGPTTVATSAPKFNYAGRQQATVGQIIALAIFMAVFLGIL